MSSKVKVKGKVAPVLFLTLQIRSPPPPTPFKKVKARLILVSSVQRVPGALSRGVKRLGREADHSPPSSVVVKNFWSNTSTPPVRLHGLVLS
jgi:hypothetical protein